MLDAFRVARPLRTNVHARIVLGAGCTILLLSQAICPTVAVLAQIAPTSDMAASEIVGEECTPCKAGVDDCLLQLIAWLEAQVRGDPTVPFPDGDCADPEGG